MFVNLMKKLLIIFCLFLAACSPSAEPPVSVAAGGAASVPQAPMTAAVMAKFINSCAMCHISGVAFAPRLGVAEDWQPRLAKGKDVLLAHTLEGFNKMPPLGYCMSCERSDFVALIDYMAGESE